MGLTGTHSSSFPKLDQAVPRGASDAWGTWQRRGALMGTHKDFEAMFAARGPGDMEEKKKAPTWRTGSLKPRSELNTSVQIRKTGAKHIVFHFGGKDWDLTDLKQSALSRTSIIKMTPSFTLILDSGKFNSFLMKGTLYTRWFVRNLVIQRSRSTNKLGLIEIQQQTRPSGLSEAAKSSLFGGEEMSAEQCRTGKNESLKEFALAYCFLLLFVSSHSSEPAKERMYFEYIYIFTKEIITTVLCLPSFAVTVGKELERLFRSGLFQGHQNLDQESGGVSDSRIAKLLGGGSRENIVKSKVGRAVKSAPPGKSRVLHSELSFGDPSPLPLANTGGHGTGDKGRFSIARRTSRPSTSRGRIGHASAAGPTFNAGRNILGDVIPTSGGWTKIEETALQEAFKSSPDEALGPDGMPKREGEDEPEAQSRPIRSAALRERERLRRRKVSINAVRMARSPLADFVLPPPQRFLFVQTRANVTGSLVGV